MAISKRLRYEILRRDNHTCRYCGATAPDTPLRIDHVTPVALGGADTPDNLVTACEPCNSGKSSVPADAAVIGDVAQDAMRWAAARKRAIEEHTQEAAGKAKKAAKVAKAYRTLYKERFGQAPHLPADANQSIARWLDLGLPAAKMRELAAYTISRGKIPPRSKWQYFAACCWGVLKDIDARTKAILTEEDATSGELQPSGQIDNDFVAQVWVQSYYGATRNPEPGVFAEAILLEEIAAYRQAGANPIDLVVAAAVAGWRKTPHLSWVLIPLPDSNPAARLAEFRAKAEELWVNAWRESHYGEQPDDEERAAFHAEIEAIRARGGFARGDVFAAAITAGLYGESVMRWSLPRHRSALGAIGAWDLSNEGGDA